MSSRVALQSIVSYAVGSRCEVSCRSVCRIVSYPIVYRLSCRSMWYQVELLGQFRGSTAWQLTTPDKISVPPNLCLKPPTPPDPAHPPSYIPCRAPSQSSTDPVDPQASADQPRRIPRK